MTLPIVLAVLVALVVTITVILVGAHVRQRLDVRREAAHFWQWEHDTPLLPTDREDEDA